MTRKGPIFIDVQADDVIRENLKNAAKNVERGARVAVGKVGLMLLRLSKQRAPHDLGDMARSGSFRMINGEGIIAYRSEYAAIVHEDPRADPKIKAVTHGQDYNIKHAQDIALGRKYFYKNKMRTYHTRKPGESWKFLEGPAIENLTVLTSIARAAIIASLRRGQEK